MENVICPNCGFQFPLDKSRDFCFCLKCGTKIEVPKYEEIQPEVQKVKPTEQPEVKNKTPKNEPKSKVDMKKMKVINIPFMGRGMALFCWFIISKQESTVKINHGFRASHLFSHFFLHAI